ncbi:MAG: aminotransferase class III-fold pyridoxal phosphate-dependent enzyme [Hyphomicrobiales bacterium]|nr:aminotransferase class III-fold pyridoxal phosphate-dependent enzyme [Hyphomicrobiales bacterium]
MLQASSSNYHNEAVLLGFSDLKRLKSERPLVFERGKGIFIFDESGKDYIEAVSCFYCASLGFSDGELVEAATRQLRALPMYSSAIHRTVPAVMELSERLAALAPVKSPRIYFATTGSEANDYLIKFMWYGNGFAGQPQRRKMLSRKSSYHGSTIATAALGGGSELHESFGIPMGISLQVSHPSWPNAALPGENEDEFTSRLAGELEKVICDAGPETVGALIAEPVSVSSGMFVPPPSYFPKITAVLRKYGIQLFIDEVVTGFGRAGYMWASEVMGLEPDCVTCAKGISGAYMPIAGIIMGEEFNRRLDLGNEAKGWFAHGGTHHAHAVSAAVAVEVLNIFERRDILGHVRRIVPHWNRMLDTLLDHPLVVGNRKFGLLGAVEVAAPGETAGALASSLKVGGLPKAIYEAGLETGVIVRPLAGCLVLSPPLIITETEIDELGRRLRSALDRVLAGMSSRQSAEFAEAR